MLGDFDYLLIFDNSTKNVAFKEDKKNISSLLEFEEIVKNKSAIETATLNLNGENYTQYLFPVTSPGKLHARVSPAGSVHGSTQDEMSATVKSP